MVLDPKRYDVAIKQLQKELSEKEVIIKSQVKIIKETSEHVGDFKQVIANEVQAQLGEFEILKADVITSDTLIAEFIKASKIYADTAWIEDLLVKGNLLVDEFTGSVGQFTKFLSGVKIYGDIITAGTISTERLIIRDPDTNKGILYEINNGVVDQTDLTEEQLKRLTLDGKVITAESITADKIAANTITSDKILAGGIKAINIASNAITSDKIAANAITTNHINTKAITAEKIDIEKLFAEDIIVTGNFELGGKGALVYDKDTDTLKIKVKEIMLESGNTVEEEIQNINVGGRNLILESDVERSSVHRVINGSAAVAEGNAGGYVPASPLVAGEEYTVSMSVTPANGVKDILVRVSNGYKTLCTIPTDGTTNPQIISQTFIAAYADGRTPEDGAVNAKLFVYRTDDASITDTTTIHWIKVEKGNKATDWTPAPEEVDDKINNAQAGVDSLNRSSIHSALSTDNGKTLASHDFTNCLEVGNISAGADANSSTKVRMGDFVQVIKGEKYTWTAEVAGSAVTPTTWLYTSSDGETFTYLSSLSTATITIPTNADNDVYIRASLSATSVTDVALRLALTNIESYIADDSKDIWMGMASAISEHPSYKSEDYVWTLTDDTTRNTIDSLLDSLNRNLQGALDEVEESLILKDSELAKKIQANTEDIESVDNKVDSVIGDDGYIHIINAAATIELGKKSNTTKVKITNNRVSLQSKGQEGAFVGIEKDRGVLGSGSAYITEYYPKVQNTDGTWTGGLVWIARSNGHLSLKVVN